MHIHDQRVRTCETSKKAAFDRCIECIMATHPSGITVEIVGIEASNNGRSCEEHDVCGSILIEDVVVRLRKVQVVNKKGMVPSAVAKSTYSLW